MRKLLLVCVLLFASFQLCFAEVPFTLKNTGVNSIYLKIPGVMNPNLSPFSTSGVDLAIGQKIFFFHKKKRYLLLIVDESLRGKSLNVGKLIKQRKKELGLS